MSAGRSKLNRKREQAIAALLTEATHDAAARKIGISSSTLSEWLKDEDFRAAWQKARLQLLDDTIALLQRTGVAAVKTLRKCLGSHKDGDRISAARAVLEFLLRGSDVLQLTEQVRQLQESIELQEGDHEHTAQPRGEAAGPSGGAGRGEAAQGPGRRARVVARGV